MIINLICWELAAILFGIMDTLAHHWWGSIFRREDIPANAKWNNFWDMTKTTAYIAGSKYKPNGWHLCKSAMIVLLAFGATSCLVWKPVYMTEWWHFVIYFLLLGIIWNTRFNFFYNKVLLKKK